jgi:serine/threonine-protein kinase RsbW
VRDFITLACETLRPADRERLVLIVEELFCNSIEHGYGGDGQEPVWLALTPTAEGCGLTYEDAAPAHDPFARAKVPPTHSHAERLPVGGLGVFLIGQLCSSTRYRRQHERNVIELFMPNK